MPPALPKGLVLASDGFFPFDDCVTLAAEYGVTAIVQPGGSVRDEDSIRKADEKGIAMVFTASAISNIDFRLSRHLSSRRARFGRETGCLCPARNRISPR